MARSKHHQHGVKQWNPPLTDGKDELPLVGTAGIASATECTGLEAQPVIDDEAAKNTTLLYGIHAQKPQGNIGKGNPGNDLSEVEFHRTEG